MYDGTFVEELKSFGNLREYCDLYLTRNETAGRNFYFCPFCKSGQGKNGTSAFSIDASERDGHGVWSCHRCGEAGSVLDLHAKLNGYTACGRDFRRAVEEVATALRYHLACEKDVRVDFKKATVIATPRERPPERDLTKYLMAAHKYLTENPGATDYLTRRGLTMETAKHFRLGYVPRWTHPFPNVPKNNPTYTPRLIIPTSRYSAIARLTLSPDEVKKRKFRHEPSKAQKIQGARLFNKRALDADVPVYVVEGEIDAMSVWQCGGEAVALGGLDHKLLLNEVTAHDEKPARHPPKYPLILSLDADKAGQGETEKLSRLLTDAGVAFIVASLTADIHDPKTGVPAKDPNDALLFDEATFRRNIQAGISKALEFERGGKTNG